MVAEPAEVWFNDFVFLRDLLVLLQLNCLSMLLCVYVVILFLFGSQAFNRV